MASKNLDIRGSLLAGIGNCRDEHIIMPSGIEKIYSCAFSTVNSIVSITFSADVKEVGFAAFMDCRKLETVNFSSKVAIFRPSVFKNCTSLKEIAIPKHLKVVSTSTFQGCTNLEKVTFDADCETHTLDMYSFAGCKALGHFTIPHSVEYIGASAFQESGLEEITIPATVKYVASHAFADCKKLKKIVIEGNIDIHKNAFDGSPLSDVYSIFFTNVPKEDKFNLVNKWLSDDKQDHNDASVVFYLNRNRLQIFRYLVSAGAAAALNTFLHLISGTFSIETIDEGIENASKNAEIIATLLEYKREHYTQQAIDKHEELQNDKALGLRPMTITDYRRYFALKKENIVYVLENTEKLSKDPLFDGAVVIPSKIGGLPVARVKTKSILNATSVFIPKTVTLIEEGAFVNSPNLERITVEAGNDRYFVKDGCLIDGDKMAIIAATKDFVFPTDGSIQKIGKQAFWKHSLSELNIPAGVKEIGENAFACCTHLTSVTISETVEKIRKGAFSNSAITKIEFHDNGALKMIENQTFEYCEDLTEVALGEGLEVMEPYVFNGCTNLKRIYIPVSMRYFSTLAFNDCNKLEEIFYGGTKRQWLELMLVSSGPRFHNTTRAKVYCTDVETCIQ